MTTTHTHTYIHSYTHAHTRGSPYADTEKHRDGGTKNDLWCTHEVATQATRIQALQGAAHSTAHMINEPLFCSDCEIIHVKCSEHTSSVHLSSINSGTQAELRTRHARVGMSKILQDFTQNLRSSFNFRIWVQWLPWNPKALADLHVRRAISGGNFCLGMDMFQWYSGELLPRCTFRCALFIMKSLSANFWANYFRMFFLSQDRMG